MKKKLLLLVISLVMLINLNSCVVATPYYGPYANYHFGWWGWWGAPYYGHYHGGPHYYGGYHYRGGYHSYRGGGRYR